MIKNQQCLQCIHACNICPEHWSLLNPGNAQRCSFPICQAFSFPTCHERQAHTCFSHISAHQDTSQVGFPAVFNLRETIWLHLYLHLQQYQHAGMQVDTQLPTL